jgi:hypothetical protein
VVGEMKTYALSLQKQSGTEALPVKVTVVLPTQAYLVSATPHPLSQTATELTFEVALDTDRQIKVVYAPGN